MLLKLNVILANADNGCQCQQCYRQRQFCI